MPDMHASLPIRLKTSEIRQLANYLYSTQRTCSVRDQLRSRPRTNCFRMAQTSTVEACMAREHAVKIGRPLDCKSVCQCSTRHQARPGLPTLDVKILNTWPWTPLRVQWQHFLQKLLAHHEMARGRQQAIPRVVPVRGLGSTLNPD